MSDDIEHLDWEVDDDWIPLQSNGYRVWHTTTDEAAGGWGRITHFQIVPLPSEEAVMRPDRTWPALLVMVLMAVPFWAVFAYGLYCLVRR